MALTAQDMLAPKGEVEDGFFPAEGLEERLEEYLRQGAEQVEDLDLDPDGRKYRQAVLAWAYHRAYHALYLRMSSRPIQAGLDGQVTSSYDPDQARRFADLSAAKLSEFQLHIRSEPRPNTESSGTSGVRTKVGW